MLEQILGPNLLKSSNLGVQILERILGPNLLKSCRVTPTRTHVRTPILDLGVPSRKHQ